MGPGTGLGVVSVAHGHAGAWYQRTDRSRAFYYRHFRHGGLFDQQTLSGSWAFALLWAGNGKKSCMRRWDGLKLLALGSAVGLTLAILARRVLANTVYQPTPRDTLVLVRRGSGDGAAGACYHVDPGSEGAVGRSLDAASRRIRPENFGHVTSVPPTAGPFPKNVCWRRMESSKWPANPSRARTLSRSRRHPSVFWGFVFWCWCTCSSSGRFRVRSVFFSCDFFFCPFGSLLIFCAGYPRLASCCSFYRFAALVLLLSTFFRYCGTTPASGQEYPLPIFFFIGPYSPKASRTASSPAVDSDQSSCIRRCRCPGRFACSCADRARSDRQRCASR